MFAYVVPIAIGFVVVFVGFVILAVFVGRRRRRACRALAHELGLHYAEQEKSYVNRYGFLKPLGKGRFRRVSNVLRGQYKGFNVKAFDFQCQTKHMRAAGKASTHRRTFEFGFLILEHEQSFPEVRIFPKGLFSKLGERIADRNVSVSNPEFEAAFCVRSKDEAFAGTLCGSELMACLLQHRDLNLEFEKHCIAMSFRRLLRVSRIAELLDQLVEIRKCLPKGLFRRKSDSLESS